MANNVAANFHSELLSTAGMNLARQALQKKYPWFIHATSFSNFSSILSVGLTPRNPDDGSTARVPDIVTAKIAQNPDKVVCLTPVGLPLMHISKPTPWCYFALSADDLPYRVGLDWSFVVNWDRTESLLNAQIPSNTESVFLKLVCLSGSVISYDGILESALRVCPSNNASNSDPSQWPKMCEVKNEADVARFDGLPRWPLKPRQRC